MKKFLAALACVLAALATAQAQSNYAVIRGAVTDQQHLPVLNAHVRVTELATSAQRESVSNGSGLYEIPGLLPGAYTLTVESAGFKAASRTIQLEVGRQAAIDVQLQVSGGSQTVRIHGSEDLLKTQDSSV